MAALRSSLIALAALAVVVPRLDAEDNDRTVEPSYPHKSVRQTEIGTGPRSYILFEPADPTPTRAPVVVFHHGWLAMNPGVYGAWIDHLVRSGNVVIYPRFMESDTPVPDYLPNALAAVVDAFDVLESSSAHIKPDRGRFALLGHSTGGVLSVQVAALARSRGLPEPRAVIAVTPGDVLRARGPNLADIPSTTLLVVVAAEHDIVTGDGRAREIFREATSLPASRKKYVLYRSDVSGRPALWADHLAPTAALAAFDNGDGPFHDFQMNQGATNAFDREGFWKVADVTIAAGFAGQTLDNARLTAPDLRRLGFWSNGRPVLPPIVADDPSEVPRTVPGHGFRLIPWQAFELAKP
jgi:acetyl esterase/lipase